MGGPIFSPEGYFVKQNAITMLIPFIHFREFTYYTFLIYAFRLFRKRNVQNRTQTDHIRTDFLIIHNQQISHLIENQFIITLAQALKLS